MPRIPRDRTIRWPRVPWFIQDLLFAAILVFGVYGAVELFYSGVDFLLLWATSAT